VRYPYERFLRFLVSRKVDPNQTLKRYGLPPVSSLWISDCRSGFRRSAPHALVRHLDSDDTELLTTDGVAEWAEREGIRLLWEIQPELGGLAMARELDLSARIFANQQARLRLGLFLFSKATSSEIAELAAIHFDMEIDPLVIETYRKIFWDSQAVPSGDWETLIDAMDRDERHYLALGFERPTLENVQCILGMKYSLEPDAVLRRLMNTSIEQYDLAMKQPIPASADALRWGEMAKQAAVALAAHVPKKAPESSIPNDFNGLFTVQISKSNHISLANLQGRVGAPLPPKPPEEA